MLSRLCNGWLSRQRLTVTEFIHSASALQKFEAAGNLYQHAIQRIAVTLAAKSETPVTQIIKALHDLTDAAVVRVNADERRGLFPVLDAKKLAETAQRLAGNPNARYILNGSLTNYLAAATTWDEKLLRVLAMRAHAPKEHVARALFLSLTDTIAAEIVGEESALSELLGAELEFGQRLMAAIQIFQGDNCAELEGPSAGLKSLAEYFARDELADARLAIAGVVLSDCKGIKRLCPSSWEGELKAFRQLADKLNAAKTQYLNQNDLNEAFGIRSKQFVTQEALSQFLAAAKTPDEKLDCLLMIAENIEGEANKRVLLPFILTLLRSPDVNDAFAAGTPGILRLKRAADLQKRVLRSSFLVTQRHRMADLLDDVAERIEAKGGFFAGLKARMPDPVERADTFLRMFATGIFTEGRLAQRARAELLAAVAVPEFLDKYASDKDRQTNMTDVVGRLVQVGISPQECGRVLKP